jgi:hypothetical protein
MLAFAHHIPDVTEHKQIAGDRAGHAGAIVNVARDKAAGETFRDVRSRIRFGDGITYPTRQFIADRDILVARQIDEAAGEIGIVGGQRRLDIAGHPIAGHRRIAIPQSRIDSGIRQRHRIVLRGQDGAGVARTWPGLRACDRAHRHTRQRPIEPRSLHPEKLISPSREYSQKIVMPLLRHNVPDERRASLGRQDCVEFA